MKILWFGPPTTKATGYGRVSYSIISRLQRRGHRIWNCGIPGVGTALTVDGITNLPRSLHPYGRDVLRDYCNLFRPDLLVSVFDVWVYTEHQGTTPRVWIKDEMPEGGRWVPIVPVDSHLDEAEETVLRPLREAHRIVVKSRFGERELLKFPDLSGKVRYIPEGCDIKRLRPVDKREAKRRLGVPEDSFVFGMVAANLGERKCISHLFKAWRMFLDRNPDARDVYFYAHTNLAPFWGVSYNIIAMRRKYGLEDRLYLPAYDPRVVPRTEEEMAELYSAFDIHMLLSAGEGFGLPLVESMSCGVPNIATDCSSITELVGGNGWLVRTIPGAFSVPLSTPTLMEYPVPDIGHAVECMEDAYYHPEKVGEFSAKGLEFAKQYDWDLIVERYWTPFLEGIQNG